MHNHRQRCSSDSKSLETVLHLKKNRKVILLNFVFVVVIASNFTHFSLKIAFKIYERIRGKALFIEHSLKVSNCEMNKLANMKTCWLEWLKYYMNVLECNRNTPRQKSIRALEIVLAIFLCFECQFLSFYACYKEYKA